MSARYDPRVLRDGWNELPGGERIFFISNPGDRPVGVARAFSADKEQS